MLGMTNETRVRGRVVNTDTVRRMSRGELETALRERGVPVDELDPIDRLRDDLMISAQGDAFARSVGLDCE